MESCRAGVSAEWLPDLPRRKRGLARADVVLSRGAKPEAWCEWGGRGYAKGPVIIPCRGIMVVSWMRGNTCGMVSCGYSCTALARVKSNRLAVPAVMGDRMRFTVISLTLD